ncbi:MAG: bifunctional DNA-formamidopyrimidine glycosylase/DNA-(apurinic or apyrimidinic site) lyase [Akkermansiaceae bacterium]|jgi:formamidopyrimidine-DNA glycosylase|nr:bifunctional DNA-formamidopyrimidine glycosylase/DNA-(apurinic or apyrimidinic site) lyase [Akkermansiaceae bacterium]
MPELPEVETTRRGIEPHLIGKRITEIIVREKRLRQPVPGDIDSLTGRIPRSLVRRGKYLLVEFAADSHLLIHLGMSGSLRVCSPADELRRHDHVILRLGGKSEIRYHDPRRFGIVLPIQGDPAMHPLLRELGPEPLSAGFHVGILAEACRKRRIPIKTLIMNHHVVVGVGNIYASEALFRAGIRPTTPSFKIARRRLESLVETIREVLQDSITQGGTTLRDFVGSDGTPGYFRQQLFVYERAGEPCRVCSTEIRHAVLGQRSTYWCPACQK